MVAFFETLFIGTDWWNYILRTVGFYLLAWLVSRLVQGVIFRTQRLQRLWLRSGKTTPERKMTIQSVLASAITFLALIAATFTTLLQFIAPDTLLWMVGLFSAAFGLGARPVISDFLAGAGFLFEDTFSVDEKVEMSGIEGVVESVNLRTTLLRAPSGELYVIPNGEIRVVRNFSRGHFSTARLQIKIEADKLEKTVPILEELGKEVVHQLPNLLEPWQVLSESGVIGKHTELIIIAKVRFGKAAEIQPRLLAVVREKLAKENVQLAD